MNAAYGNMSFAQIDAELALKEKYFLRLTLSAEKSYLEDGSWGKQYYTYFNESLINVQEIRAAMKPLLLSEAAGAGTGDDDD